MQIPEVAEYPDTGTWLAMTDPGEGKVFPAGTDVTIGEAMRQAMKEGAVRDDE